LKDTIPAVPSTLGAARRAQIDVITGFQIQPQLNA
jgi:hypothetical protein